MFTDNAQCMQLGFRVVDEPRGTEHGCRAVLQRRIECRPGKHEAIDSRHVQASLRILSEPFDDAGLAGAVQIDRLSVTAEEHRHDNGGTVFDESDRGGHGTVDHVVHGLPIIDGVFAQLTHAVTSGSRVFICHRFPRSVNR